MKNILKICIALTVGVLGFTSCLEDNFDTLDGGKAYANIYPTASVSYFAGQTTSITVDVSKFENPGVSITSITVTKQLFTTIGDSDKVTFDFSGDSFSQTSAELFADVPVAGSTLTEGNLSAGDYWSFNYAFTLSDGTVLTQSGGTKVTFLCPSTLDGTMSFSTVAWCGGTETGTATWTLAGDGLYTTVDFTYGAYIACYGGGFYPDGSLQIQDVCGKLTPIGNDQWGDSYSYNSVTLSGNDLVIDWVNTYGEAGVTTLTRTDGKTWPSNLN